MGQPERQWPASAMQFATIVAAIVAMFFIASIVSRTVNIYDLKRQQAALQRTYRNLVQTTDGLRDEVKYLQSDSYIEQAARTMLLWGRPGEKLIIFVDDAASVPPSAPPPRRP